MSQRIVFEVPLPPPALRANSRAHWGAKKAAADAYSETVYHYFHATVLANFTSLYHEMYAHWPKAKVTYTWKYAGAQPDHGNLGGHTKYLQDCLQVAPSTKAGANRWYLGIVEDDKGITAEYRLEKVAHRDQEGVRIEIEALP